MLMSRYRSLSLGLRMKCFIVAYMNLFACVIDIVCHVLVVAIATNGFQCDVSWNSNLEVQWPWLEPFLLAVNVGTHGFYPLPLVSTQTTVIERFRIGMPSEITCYPGMFHVQLEDMFNFLINLIWLSFVKYFVRGVSKKEPEALRMFLGVGILKLILQIMYFGYQPYLRTITSIKTIVFIKLMDICISAFCLYIIYQYIKVLVEERRSATPRVVDQPPSYIECLIGTSNPIKDEKKDTTSIESQPAKVDVVSVA